MLALLATFAAFALLAPAASAAEPAKPDAAAEAAAAMERAKRLAANPLRVILEASKLRRKVGADPELPVPTGAASPAVPVALNAPQTGAAATASGLPRGDEAPAVPRPLPVPAPVRTLSATPLAAHVGDSVPALAGTDKLAAPQALTLAPMAAVSTSPAATTPRLIDMVEPVIPPRLLDELGRAVEFNADLTIRPDGSVAQVTLLPPVNRSLARYVVTAMERWRFAPLPTEHLHRVQLVFNEGK